MNKYHNLIWDESQCNRFYALLPELARDECFTMCLFARKKYLTDIQKADLNLNTKDSAIDRVIIDNKSDWSYFLRRIKKYEVAVDCYTDKDNKTLPSNCLAVYCDINPRSCIKALKEFTSDSIQDCMRDKRHIDYTNIVSRVKSKVQSICSKKYFADLDIDIKDARLLKELTKMLAAKRITPWETIETRGGYHILLNLKMMNSINKRWYPDIQEIRKYFDLADVIELKTDTMCPIPGTIQGGFNVRFI